MVDQVHFVAYIGLSYNQVDAVVKSYTSSLEK